MHPSGKTYENPQVRIWHRKQYKLAECCNHRDSPTPLLRYDIAEGSSFCRIKLMKSIMKKSAKKNTAQNQERRTDEYDRMRSIVSIPFKRSCYLS